LLVLADYENVLGPIVVEVLLVLYDLFLSF
jgi:hypothetical protein